MLTTDELAQVAAHVYELLNARAPIGRNGMVVPNSYDPERMTVDVLLTDTAIVFPDDASMQPQVEQGVPLATTHLDDGHGPFGGEQVHLVPIQSGYIAHLYRTPDPGVDSPGTPQGDRWISLRDPDGTIIAYVRLQQNGGKGELSMLAGALLNIWTTAGFGLVADDVNKEFSIVSPGGLYFRLDDNVGRAMVGKTGLGQSDAIMTQTDGQALANALIAAFQTALNLVATTRQPGTGPAAPTIAPVTAMGSSDASAGE